MALAKDQITLINVNDGYVGNDGKTYILNILGGQRSITYNEVGASPSPSPSAFTFELLIDGVSVAPTSIGWSATGHLNGTSTAATFTPTYATNFNSSYSNVINLTVVYGGISIKAAAPIAVTRVGEVRYTWIKYADTVEGGGISNSPAGKKYIGIAANKSVSTESSNPGDYTWSLFEGPQGADGYTPVKGTDYFDGQDGQDGTSSYLWVRYSQNANGNPMTTDATGAKYIGTATTTVNTAPSGYASYKWSLVKGTDGLPGEDGVDGKTSYLHIKYSNDGGATFTANSGETVGSWIGTYVDFTAADSTSVSAYTWNKVKGEPGYTPVKGTDYFDGKDGQNGTSSYLWIRYSQNSNGSSMTTDPANAKYIGTATTTTATVPAYTSFSWSLIKGTDGVKGETGANGQTSYLHIKYSNDGGVNFTANGGETVGEWIGTYVDFTAADSTSVSAYTWNKVKGDTGSQGLQGVQGPKGADGTTYYTWIKYADTPTTGMDNLPDGKTYMGIAHNKATATESSNYAEYTWSLIKGTQGIQGPKGGDGQTTYTWVKYADTETGSGMSDTPDGKRYLGLAYNKTTATESSTASDYSWSPLYDNVVVGGRNLLLNSNFSTGDISNWSVNGAATVVEVDGFNAIQLTGVNGGFYNYPIGKEGGVYTVSFKAKPVGTTSSLRVGFLNAGISSNIAVSGSWSRYSFTMTSVSANQLFLFYANGNTSSGVYITDIKLEKGNIATDWTPAPEDIQTDIDALATRVSTAELKITPEAITSTVRSSTAYTTDLAGKQTILKQTTAPAHVAGLLWLDISVVPNVLKRSTGSTWVKITPTTAGEVGAYSSTDGSALAGRVTTAESSITQQAGQITSKVSQTDYNTKMGTFTGTVSTIKQTADAVKLDFENQQIGGRNILLKSGIPITTSSYLIKDYMLTEAIPAGTEVTLTIKGTLASTKTSFAAYNSGGSVGLTPNITNMGGGIYQKTFTWAVGASSNTYVSIYQMASGQTGTSTIQWIKLEKGNVATDWSPNPNELTGATYSFDGNSFKIGGFSGDKVEHTNSLSKYTHSDGSYTQIGVNGMERFVSGTGQEYHYLIHAMTFIQGVSGTTRWLQLPDEFKGKQFSIYLAIADSIDAISYKNAIQRFVATKDANNDIDYTNARVPIIAYKTIVDMVSPFTSTINTVQGMLLAIY